MFAKVVLILGGNLGDRENLINQAMKSLLEKSRFIANSALYETQAWGNIAKGDFLNQVIEIETSLFPQELLTEIQEIEEKLGRNRTEIWGDRTMDIDILYYNDMILNTPELTIPHPFIQERKFVLVPLVEILPEMIHPVLRKSNRTLLEECQDSGDVKIYPGK